ncbi:Glycosyltransferase involved in cell wall bisynthesis [Butyrivibrio sp. ob235]|uniref:glycosyltransferase n=1 Tax=Butyrivibrio sp. ob235 TaxID=1761780 RepID=UPI0008B5AA55|nr:glycosyltransferase [Butyrivibrio sp. ob235]SEK63811.1 Glycosyltransferase involved in cell wall bisynthesis [Butyrivibrio sp. ob235]
MKKVLFDLYSSQPIDDSKFHGGGEYIKAIFRHAIEVAYHNQTSISVFFDNTIFIDEWILESIESAKIKVHNISNINDVQKILNENGFDIFFSGLPTRYYKLIIPPKTRFIGTIHGLRPIELLADRYSYKYYSGIQSYKMRLLYCLKRIRVKKALDKYGKTLAILDQIMTDSFHSLYSIKCFFPNINKDIKVLYPPIKYYQNSSHNKIDLDSRYILILGMNRWEKNSYRAILAFEDLFSKGFLKDYKVVTVGRISDQVQKKMQYKEKYYQYDYVEPEFLEELYRNCDLFIYPSINEGFGYPPLEAMKYGITCAVSAVCSIPEVCGDAVYYFNPYDINEIKNRILQSLEMKKNPELVKRRFDMIYAKQEEDLDKLCKLVFVEENV